ncbi:MAG: FAD:protein FMN transferase [Acidimicrobiia bacterium]
MRRTEHQWGTVIGIDVRDDVDPALVDDAYAWFARVDDLFSTFRADTEIMRIARGELAVGNAAAEVVEVLELCERVRDDTQGAFDITFGARSQLPPHEGSSPIDPSGLVKGWAVQRAADRLSAAGARNFWINAGGDIVARGRAGDGPWRIGLQHPWERQKLAAAIAVEDRAVATSGVYERGDHVIDPLTGTPVCGITAVTVIGNDLTFVDAYATAVLVLGRPGLEWIAGLEGFEAFAITDDREVVVTPGFDRYRIPLAGVA